LRFHRDDEGVGELRRLGVADRLHAVALRQLARPLVVALSDQKFIRARAGRQQARHQRLAHLAGTDHGDHRAHFTLWS
jgi:hypothetical protein